jgi:hypothetical protein
VAIKDKPSYESFSKTRIKEMGSYMQLIFIFKVTVKVAAIDESLRPSFGNQFSSMCGKYSEKRETSQSKKTNRNEDDM